VVVETRTFFVPVFLEFRPAIDDGSEPTGDASADSVGMVVEKDQQPEFYA
jgi:hypothetical protein